MSKMIPVDLIDPSPWADMFPHDEEHVAALAVDIKERRIQTPLHVWPKAGRYEMLTGHDRLAAAKRIGLREVPCVERSTLTEEERFVHFIADNTQRKAVDKARIVRGVLAQKRDWSNNRIGQLCGCSHEYVRQIREAMEADGTLQPVATRTDSMGREQPARKPREPKLVSSIDEARKKKEAKQEKLPSATEMLRAAREKQAADAPPVLPPVVVKPAPVEAAKAEAPTPKPEKTQAPERAPKPRSVKESAAKPVRSGAWVHITSLASGVADVSDAEIVQVVCDPEFGQHVDALRKQREFCDRVITAYESREVARATA